jgi:flagellar basal body L-ring protein FlgH
MIMKTTYAVALLTSLALVAMAASVPAQQDTFQAQRRSTDAAPTEKPSTTFYQNDLEPRVNQQPRSVLFSTDRALGIGDIPARDQFAVEESTLANEANEIRHHLESTTTDAQRSEIRTKLAENLGKQFDVRQKRHGLEIEALEMQVKKLKELVRRRQESRAEIISRRVDQILREADGLGW